VFSIIPLHFRIECEPRQAYRVNKVSVIFCETEGRGKTQEDDAEGKLDETEDAEDAEDEASALRGGRREANLASSPASIRCAKSARKDAEATSFAALLVC
jgi:hypothetical protein